MSGALDTIVRLPENAQGRVPFAGGVEEFNAASYHADVHFINCSL